jgi:hypothetical protein
MSKKSEYIDISESSAKVSALQVDIMLFVDVWVKRNNTPVPRQEIVNVMKKKGKTKDQIEHALNLLLRLGYVRKAVTISNKTSYVQLRRVNI